MHRRDASVVLTSTDLIRVVVDTFVFNHQRERLAKVRHPDQRSLARQTRTPDCRHEAADGPCTLRKFDTAYGLLIGPALLVQRGKPSPGDNRRPLMPKNCGLVT